MRFRGDLKPGNVLLDDRPQWLSKKKPRFFEGFVSNGGFFGMVFWGLEDSNGVSEV